jgi:hypothetical protein
MAIQVKDKEGKILGTIYDRDLPKYYNSPTSLIQKIGEDYPTVFELVDLGPNLFGDEMDAKVPIPIEVPQEDKVQLAVHAHTQSLVRLTNAWVELNMAIEQSSQSYMAMNKAIDQQLEDSRKKRCEEKKEEDKWPYLI